MKARIAACILALGGLALPALAEVRVNEIIVHQSAPTPEGTNIRINLENPSRKLEKPGQVLLQVRETADQPWQTVKTFRHHMTLMAGKKMALDYLPAQGEEMNPILTKQSFQIRAVVMGRGQELASQERSYTANYEAFVMP